MEKAIRRALMLGALAGLLLGTAVGWLGHGHLAASRAADPGLPCLLDPPPSQTPQALAARRGALEQKLNVKLFGYNEALTLATMGGLEAIQERARGREPVVVYDWFPLGGCVVFDLLRITRGGGQAMAVVMNNDGTWLRVYEYRVEAGP